MKKLMILWLMPIFMYLHASAPTFLEAKDAFKARMTQVDEGIRVEIELAEKIYVYKDKVSLTSPDATLEYTLPEGTVHEGFEGPETVYENKLDFIAKIHSVTSSNAKVQVTFLFNGCSADGLCYPPIELKQSFSVAKSSVPSNETAIEEDVSDEDKIQAIFSGSFILILLTFFGLGVLLSLTPCIFPMIPILSSIIVSQGENITTRRSFFLSIVYVLAMAVAYTLAGIASAYSGDSIQAALQIPWVLVLFSLIFVALSLSMFGFYDLEMPKWVQSRVTKVSQDAEGKGVLGVAIMGFLSALIVGPCVAAPLAGVLAYIGQTGDAVLGGSALFMMSVGMGLPLLIIGLGAGRFMPKPGGWMDAIKAIFGVMMLGVAIWMLKRVVDESVTMLLISFLAIISSLYLGALDPHVVTTRGWHRFSKGLGVLILLYGVVMFVGSFTKGTLYDPLRSFSGQSYASNTTAQSSGLLFTHTIQSNKALDTLLEESMDKIVMLDFTASWCEQCEEVERDVFASKEAILATKGFILVHADISKDSKETKALKARLEVQGPPAIRFFRAGKEISRASRMQAPTLEDFLNKIAKF